jgi:hypothetical protein
MAPQKEKLYWSLFLHFIQVYITEKRKLGDELAAQAN